MVTLFSGVQQGIGVPGLIKFSRAALLLAAVSMPVAASGQALLRPEGAGLTAQDVQICRIAAQMARTPNAFNMCLQNRAGRGPMASLAGILEPASPAQASMRHVSQVVGVGEKAKAADAQGRWGEAAAACEKIKDESLDEGGDVDRMVWSQAGIAREYFQNLVNGCRFRLGYYAERGLGTHQDYRKALSLYATVDRAVINPSRIDRHAALLYYGAGGDAPDPSAIAGDKTLISLAAAGAMPATLSAFTGFDSREALVLASTALNAQDYTSAYRLAYATQMLSLSDDQAMAPASYLLAILYMDGKGVAEDDLKARQNLQAAVSSAYAPAEALQGRLYSEGALFPRNHDQAVRYLLLAQHHGSTEAAAYLADEDKIYAQEQAEKAALVAAEEARRQKQLAQLGRYIETVLADDSKTWQSDKFIAHSVSGVTVVDGVIEDGAYTVRADYKYNGSQDGWVSVTMEDGHAKCLTYWNFASSCRKPGEPNALLVGGELLAALVAADVIASAANSGHGGRGVPANYGGYSPPASAKITTFDTSRSSFISNWSNASILQSRADSLNAQYPGSPYSGAGALSQQAQSAKIKALFGAPPAF